MKIIFVTGGVISGLGKGITASSIGKLMQSSGYSVNMVKIDPYLQVDAGTMSPYEHGEVYVCEDGTEADLDLGNYERFVDLKLSGINNPTTGKVYLSVIQKERRGDYLGKTVQVIPHITNEIKDRIISCASNYDVTVVEVGGMVGDVESTPFIEAIRQMRKDLGDKNVAYVHVVPLLYLPYSGETKTKPIQSSVRDLRSAGIMPDMLICRSPIHISDKIRQKISLFADIDEENVIQNLDLESIYELPIELQKQGFEQRLQSLLDMPLRTADLSEWEVFVDNILHPKQTIHVGIVGKYTEFEDTYASLKEAIVHAGAHNSVQIKKHWISTEDLTDNPGLLSEIHKNGELDAVIVPGGFGQRGSEAKIQAIQFVRENNIPFLGICLGMQMAVVEYARNVCGIADACSTEFDDNGTPFVDYLPDQDDSTDKGGTMRLGSYEAHLTPDTLVANLYNNAAVCHERHRHRYEVCADRHMILEQHGLIISGKSEDGRLAEFIELKNHPYFVATQAHPEFTSRPNHPNPLFDGLIVTALGKK